MKFPGRRTFLLFAAPILLLAIIVTCSPRKQPAPAPVAPIAAAQPTVDNPQADLILDLFEPDSNTLAAQHSEAAISNQIEHALVVSFLLARCQLINKWEYSESYNAFIRYTVDTGLAPDLNTAAIRVKAIAASASASYSLIYSRVPCTDPSLPPLVGQLETWRKKYKPR